MKVEKDLIRRAKKGDFIAFEDLICGYEKKVYNTVFRFFNNEQDAMDITQEIFIKVFISLKSFRENSSFSTWLYRISVNTCIDFFRKKKEDMLPINEEMAVGGEVKLGSQTELPEVFVQNQELNKFSLRQSTLCRKNRGCV